MSDINNIFEQFANVSKKEQKKKEDINVRYRGCGRKSKVLSGAASDVTRYIYEDGVCVGTEIIKVRKKRS